MVSESKTKDNIIIKITVKAVLCLFVLELIFGYTGTMIMIMGNPIRKLTYLLTGATLYLSSLYLLIKDRKVFLSIKKAMRYDDRKYLILDIVLGILIVFFLAEIFIIPRFTGVNLFYARADALDAVAVLILFYPIRYLIGKGIIDKDYINKLIKYSVVALSLLHIVNYIGQMISKTFMKDAFVFVDSLIPGESIYPSITQGHLGYPRVIFGTSVYLVMGIYYAIISLKNNKWHDYLYFVAVLVGILTTMTRSIWFGILAGLFVVAVIFIYRTIRYKDYKLIKMVGIYIAVAIVTIFLTDKLLFNNMIGIRTKNSFVTDESEKDLDNTDQMYDIEFEGAVQANTLRVEQTVKLLEKWKERPIIGFGFGAYVEDYLISEDIPYSYDMQAPTLLMKTGVTGCILVVGLIGYMMFTVQKNQKNLLIKLAWLFLIIAFGLTVQTNPLLFSYTGMSVVLFLLVTSRLAEPEDRIEA